MQIFIAFLLLLTLLAFIIYKINNRFEKKEFISFTLIVVIGLGGYLFYESQQEEYFPNKFKAKYYETKQLHINKLSYKLLNNKNITSKKYFVYSFTYLINKDNTDYLCTAPKVEIEKIEDDFIFKNFKALKEVCQKQ